MKEAITADKSLYNAVAQRYYWLQSTKRNLLEDRIRIEARLHMIDEEMVALNDILCKHGKHLYEHFEKKDCISCTHSDELDGEYCYECVKGDKDNFEADKGE